MCSYVHAFTHVYMHICFCFPAFVCGWPDDPHRGHLLGRPWWKQAQLDANLRHADIICAVRTLSTFSGVSRLCLHLSTLDPLWFGKGPGAEYRRRNLFSSILKDPPSPRNNVGIKSLPTKETSQLFCVPNFAFGGKGNLLHDWGEYYPSTVETLALRYKSGKMFMEFVLAFGFSSCPDSVLHSKPLHPKTKIDNCRCIPRLLPKANSGDQRTRSSGQIVRDRTLASWAFTWATLFLCLWSTTAPHDTTMCSNTCMRILAWCGKCEKNNTKHIHVRLGLELY